MIDRELYSLINEYKMLLSTIRCYPSIDKTTLSREIKISFPTLIKQLEILKEKNLLCEDSKITINESAFYACGISIGGAQCKITLIDASYRVLKSSALNELCDKTGIFKHDFLKTGSESSGNGYRYFETPKNEIDLKVKLNAIIEDILKLDTYAIECEEIPQILSIGIALTGAIDAEKQIVISSHNIGYLNNLKKEMLISPELINKLKERSIPIVLDHNAKALAVCEKYSLFQIDNYNKEYSNKRNIVSLYLGSGIGSGLIIDNKLARGCRNLNGEIGHINVPRYPDLYGKKLIEENCTCGAKGCLEHYIINDVFRMKRDDFKGVTSEKLIEKLNLLDSYEKDERLKILGYYIGWAIDFCVKFLNVDLIVFSGKISCLMDELWKYISSSNGKADYGRLDCSLITSKYGALAPTIGAGILSTYPTNENIEWPEIKE